MGNICESCVSMKEKDAINVPKYWAMYKMYEEEFNKDNCP